MLTFLKYAAAFVVAVFSTSVLASVFSSQSVIASLQAINVEVPLTSRLSMTLVDLKILQTLALVSAACLLVGFVVAALCNKYISSNRTAWYVLAGTCALITTLLLMSYFLQLAPIAGARTIVGLAFQGLAGAVGGYLFAKLTHHRASD